MSMINYKDPIIISWNVDDNGSRVSVPVYNEQIQIINGKSSIDGIPDEQYRVFIDGFVEINIKDKITELNQYKVDYTHSFIYFNPNIGEVSLTVNKYYSRGVWRIPASKIYTEIDDLGNVVSTLADLEGDLGEMVSQIDAINIMAENASGIATSLETNVTLGATLNTNLQTSVNTATTKKTQLDNSISTSTKSKSDLDTSISSANTSKSKLDISIGNATTSRSNLDSSISSGDALKVNLDESITNGTTLKNNLDANITTGDQLKVDLPPLISSAGTAKTNLDGSINLATTKKSELDGSIGSATTKKTDLDSSISSANTINNTLSNSTSGTIKKANDANSTLNTSISSSNSSKTVLDESIATANTSKTNLDASVATANTTKAGLDGSITTGNALKSELGDIISGTDYEQVIIDVNSMKQDQHNHTNKPTLDKFTEVDNKPYYNGAEIGGAVPNLTLNELTLGGRYKIVYNYIEDSLDIEVI